MKVIIRHGLTKKYSIVNEDGHLRVVLYLQSDLGTPIPIEFDVEEFRAWTQEMGRILRVVEHLAGKEG